MPSNNKRKTSPKGKTAAKRAPAKKQPEVAPSNLKQEAIGIGIVCLGLLLAYCIFTGGTSGLVGVLYSASMGLAGKLCYILPFVVVWFGFIVCFSKKDSKPNKGRIALCGLLVLLVFGIVELFSVESILNDIRRNTYGSFLIAAFQKEAGAGLIGALTAWPLYAGLGLHVAGSMILYICTIIVILILLRKISLSSLRTHAKQRINDVQQHVQERREEWHEIRELRREEEERAQLFIPNLKKEGKAPARKKVSSDAFTVDDDVEIALPEAAESPMVTESPTLRALRESKKESKAPQHEFPSRPSFLDRSTPVKTAKPTTIVPIIEDEPVPEAEEDDFPLPKGNSIFLDELGIEPVEETQSADDPEPPFDIPVEKIDIPGMTPIQATEPEEVLDLPDDDDDDELPFSDRPGASLIDPAPVLTKQPAQPLPSFSEEKEMYAPIHTQMTNNAPDVYMPAKPFSAPAAAVQPAAPAAPAAKPAPVEEPQEYNYPPVDLLAQAKPTAVHNLERIDAEKGSKLVAVLQSFGISTKLIGVAHGPTVTRYELVPAAGVKVSKITNLVDDIALGLAAKSVRIEAPIPGKSAVGVEVPNDQPETVPLRDVLESSEAQKHPSRIAAAIGRDNSGRNIICDLAKMPHILIAGATGSGKSVCINSIICSILYRATPEEVRLIMIDPKMVELSVYNNIPHLLVPVVTDPKKAAGALEWTVNEMTQRYKKFAAAGTKDLKGYNLKRPEGEKPMPQIVVIIDELADLMMVAPGDVEDAVCRIAQLARAAGIHLVIATQRPSVNVITGVIKANIPSRIAFTVASQVDSRTILDIGGAEKLLMHGDMLYAPSGTNKPLRVQGCWISEDEVQSVVDYITARHSADYSDDLREHLSREELSDADKKDLDEQRDELLETAIEYVVEAGQASISMLQRKMRIGYARAGRLIDEMTKRGIVSEAEGAKPREVLISREQFRMQFKD